MSKSKSVYDFFTIYGTNPAVFALEKPFVLCYNKKVPAFS